MSKVNIMGVLNLTPDSFYDGNRKILSDRKYLNVKMEELLKSDIIDVGCESSRPGSKPISSDLEIDRLSNILDIVSDNPGNLFSIDTYKPEVAEYALKSGFKMVNDIYAGTYKENKMFEVVSDFNVPVVLMHMKGSPLNMQKNTQYDSIIDDIMFFFEERINEANKYGISKNDIILDPGIGFGKSFEDNFKIVKNIEKFKSLGHRVLIGLSRKNFLIYENDSPEDRLSSTISMNTVSILNGADIIRVHDVLEALQALNVLKQYGNVC